MSTVCSSRSLLFLSWAILALPATTAAWASPATSGRPQFHDNATILSPAGTTFRNNAHSEQGMVRLEERGLEPIRQLNVPKGLDRIDGKMDGFFTYQDGPLGKGVDIYIIGSGVETNVADLNGRITLINALNSGNGEVTGGQTELAEVAAGTVSGIAKKAHVIGVNIKCRQNKVYDDYLTYGIRYVIQSIQQRKAPSIVQLAADIGDFIELRRNLEPQMFKLIQMGVAFVFPAGDQYSQVGGNRLKSISEGLQYVRTFLDGSGLVVGAVDVVANTLSVTSKAGRSVDLYAPGTDSITFRTGITSEEPCPVGDTDRAAARVTGVMAVLMSMGLNAVHARQFILRNAQPNVIQDLPFAGNLLLHLPPHIKLGFRQNLRYKARRAKHKYSNLLKGETGERT